MGWTTRKTWGIQIHGKSLVSPGDPGALFTIWLEIKTTPMAVPPVTKGPNLDLEPQAAPVTTPSASMGLTLMAHPDINSPKDEKFTYSQHPHMGACFENLPRVKCLQT